MTKFWSWLPRLQVAPKKLVWEQSQMYLKKILWVFMWVPLLGLFLWGFLGVFLGTITDGPQHTQSMSTLRMYLHECLSRNLWHLHPYHFSFLSIISLVHSHHRQNQRLNFFWSQWTITTLCILLMSVAVVNALINVIGYKRLVSGGNKTLCKHNRGVLLL